MNILPDDTQPLPYIPQHDWDHIETLRNRPHYSPKAAVSMRHKLREKIVDRRTAWRLVSPLIVQSAQHAQEDGWE